MKTTEQIEGRRRTSYRPAIQPSRRSTPAQLSDDSGPQERKRLSRRQLRNRGIALVILALGVVGALVMFRSQPAPPPPLPEEIHGSSAWASEHYGDPDAPGFRIRNITTIEFLGRSMFVHKKAARHFLRLERLFEARAPAYAAAVVLGELDDWSYANRVIRGSSTHKSNHAYGLAIDVNALTNVLGTTGDMPAEVVTQWEREGGDWGGDWARPDPMHFETHLTPSEITKRYRPDGTPKDWYLEELVEGRRPPSKGSEVSQRIAKDTLRTKSILPEPLDMIDGIRANAGGD